MAYLYGEMSPEERKEFEWSLSEDAALREELEGFEETRFNLRDLPDIKPQATVLSVAPVTAFNWRKLALRAGIAASFLLLLALSNVRLVFTKNSFAIAFGKVAEMETDPSSSQMAITQQAEDLKLLLSQKEIEFNQKLMAMDSLWQVQLAQNNEEKQAAFVNQWKAFQARQAAELVALRTQFREKELPQFAALIQEMQVGQKQELQLLLTDFWENWQATRVDDLKAIETELVNLYQNVERNQNETAVVIDNIIRGNF